MSRGGSVLALLGAALWACDDGGIRYVGAHNPVARGGVGGEGAVNPVAQGGAVGESAVLGCPLRGGEARYGAMTSGGVERRFLVAAPPNYDPGRAYPVVLVFHARDEDGAFIRQELGLETADPDWAVFVYPDGLEREWSDGSVATGWQNGPATSYYGGTEDLEFVRDLIVHLEGELCIQIENLFATGRWWGGEFASVVGCYLGERVDAIVPVHGNTPYFLPLSPDAEPPCVGEVAVWVFHGQGDEMFTLQDGTEQRDFWLGRNGCAPDSAAPLEPSGATADDACVEYACSGPRTRFCAFAASYVRRPPAYYAASATEFLQYLR